MKFLKLLVGVGFVMSLASLGGNWFLYQRYQAELAAGDELESQLVQLEEQNESLQTEAAKIDQYKQENDRLLGQVKDHVNQRDALKEELKGAYGQITSLKKQIQGLEAEKTRLAEQVNLGQVTDSAIAREASKLPSAPVVAPAEPAKAPKKPKKAEKKKEEPAKKEAEVKKEAKPAGVGPVATEDGRPLQVLSVNRQFNFVVVNVGLRDRIKIGDPLRVEQNGKLIGRVQVEKLYENFSACTILEEVKPAQIREGDLVRIA